MITILQKKLPLDIYIPFQFLPTVRMKPGSWNRILQREQTSLLFGEMLDEPKRKEDVRNLCAVLQRKLDLVSGNYEKTQRTLKYGEFNQRTPTRSGIFAHLSLDFEQTFGQIVSSRYIKEGKSSLPVDVRRSKTLLLKLPNKYPGKLVTPSCWLKTFLNYLQLMET